MRQLLTIIIAMLVILTVAASSGCTQEPGSRLQFYLRGASEVLVGFTITLVITTTVEIGEEHVETYQGTWANMTGKQIHWRYYDVTVTLDDTTFTKTQGTPIVSEYSSAITGSLLYSDSVATWEGQRFNQNGAVIVTTTDTGELQYDIAKPSSYISAHGYSYTFSEALSDALEIVTDFRASVNYGGSELWGQHFGDSVQIPNYSTTGTTSRTTTVQVYVPCGGKLGDFTIKGYSMEQRFKFGYTQEYYNSPFNELEDYIVTWQESTLGFTGFDVPNALFGTHFDASGLTYMGTVMPYQEAVTNPMTQAHKDFIITIEE